MSSIRRFDGSLTGEDTREFTYRLMSCNNFLPDVYHDYSRMMEEYSHMLSRCCQPYAMVTPDNKIGGAFFISDVVPGHEAILYVWIWDNRAYTATTARFFGEYIEAAAGENELARIVCRTPDDKKLGRLLEKMGFKLESRAKSGWKGGGRLSTLFGYRRLFRSGGA